MPHEWNIRNAYIASDDGTHIVDFAANNLHIVQYSRPIDTICHSLSYAPISIPYLINLTGFRIVRPITSKTGVFA